ncbi:MAG: serine/threonine-protein kinase [Myxococcota bacterium]
MSEVLDSLHPKLRDLPGSTIVGRYRVDSILGVGGMGAVFRGRHLGLERDVAIKVLHPELTRDPEISKRFDREAHSASRLDHPNCLRVTDVGSSDDGVKFMVMDLLDGEELADRLGKPLTPERAVLLVLQVLRGLEHAHENGVIHRDIKPENIFATRDHEGREVLKLVDFGIAKLLGGSADDRMTKAGLIFGTPAYMSPEQAMGMEADARADLYSVGVILYEMLVGQPPFANEDPVKLVRMQVSKDPPPLPDTLAPALVAVTMKLLAKDRDERFQNATESREALELVLPAVASAEVISGATILGSSTSGPILINRTNSGPLPLAADTSDSSVPYLRPPESSTTFSPSALPTLPPQGTTLRGKRSNKRPMIIAGVIVAVAGIWVLSSGGDETEGKGDDPVSTAQKENPADSSPAVAGGEGATPAGADHGYDDDPRLAEVDGLTFRNRLDDAQTLLQPMLDEDPDSAVLAWRQGRILAKRKRRKHHSRALASYGDALDANPALLEDHDFYAELLALLSNTNLRSEALDFALRKMGQRGHKFLLELVNDEKNPMGYSDRRRALQELSTVEDNGALVNWRLHRALDLLQATKALAPCKAYRSALDEIAESPDYWYLTRVQRASLPKAKVGPELTDEELADAEQCEGIEEYRDEVMELLAALDPEGDSDGDLVIIDDEDEEESSDNGGGGGSSAKPKKKSGSGRSKRPAECNRPFGFMKKQCQ